MAITATHMAAERERWPLEWARVEECARILAATQDVFQAATAAWMDAYVQHGEHAGATVTRRRARMLKLDELEHAELAAERALGQLEARRVERRRAAAKRCRERYAARHG